MRAPVYRIVPEQVGEIRERPKVVHRHQLNAAPMRKPCERSANPAESVNRHPNHIALLYQRLAYASYTTLAPYVDYAYNDFVSRYYGCMQLFHALNRGTDGRDIFMKDDDRVRFIRGMYLFNNPAPANNTGWKVDRFRPNNDFVSRYSGGRLVDIHGWCLMRNHYHLLLSERQENGVTAFLTKLNIGYAKFFNEKYKRSGTLFQGRTKKVLIERDAHMLYILHYIHLNPLDYLADANEWRMRSKGSIPSATKALDYLQTYRWSSLRDYLGERNFPSILTTSFFTKMFGAYGPALSAYLKDAELLERSSMLE